MRVFASPGIDTDLDDQGILNSGAGQQGGPSAAPDNSGVPWDWKSNNPAIDRNTGLLIGGFGATSAPNAKDIRIRKRGISPWGSNFLRFKSGKSLEKSGGIVDHNSGAGSLIAGGHGAAASMVRMHGPKKGNEGQKLPVLPKQATRGNPLVMPDGPNAGIYASPVVPKVPGFASIFKIVTNPASVK